MYKSLYGKRYQLHWAASVISTFQWIKEAFLPILLIFGLNLLRDGFSFSSLISISVTIGIILVVMIVLSLFSVIQWHRFEYWFEEDELRIEHGVFVRKKRYIPFERIQSLDYTESILHRMFGLVQINIETASSGGEPEVALSAVSKSAAEAIEAVIEDGKRQIAFEKRKESNVEQQPVERKNETIFEMKTKDLLILATTSGGIGVILSGLLLFSTQFIEFIPTDFLYTQFKNVMQYSLVVIGLILLVVFGLAWILSVAMTYIAYYSFKVQKDDENIMITRGLLEKKKVTIPLKRVQAIEVVQNPFRQLIGYETVILHSAGGVGDGQRLHLLPLVPKVQRNEPLYALFPTMHFVEPKRRLTTNARPYFRRIHYNWILPIIAIATYYAYPYGLWAALLIPLNYLFAHWRYRSAAYDRHRQQFIARHRSFSLYTMYVTRRRVQSVTIRQSIFQRRGHVGTLFLNLKSGSSLGIGKVPHMPERAAEQAFLWMEKRTREDEVNRRLEERRRLEKVCKR